MKTPIGPEIVFELGGVSSPAISPDGAVVAYVRGQVAEGKRTSWIECAPFEGGASRRLTAGPVDSSPSFSPDGSSLAFLRPGSAEAGSPRQIWLLPTDGGEAQRLTELPHAVSAFDWLPDGSGMIASVDIDPHRGARDGSKTTVVRDTYYRGDALGYREDAWHQLFRIDAETGHTVQLTHGTFNHAHPVVSPDGHWVAFTADRNVDREKRRPFGSELCVMSTHGVGGGHVERLTPGVMSAGRPCWSPDGTALAVSVTDMSQRHQAYLERVERYSGKRTRLTDDSVNPQTGFFPIAAPPTMIWQDDAIAFAGDTQGRSGVFRVAADGSEAVESIRAEHELINGFDVSVDGRSIAIVSTTPDAPGEIISLRTGSPPLPSASPPNGGRNVTALTSSAADFVAEHEIGEVEFFTVERDGWMIPCGLMFPPGFDPEQSYPVIMEIHGGPNGFFGEGFNVLHQVIAGAGYLVLFVNPRGSSTFGARFTDAVTVDWGGEDSLDLLHTLDVVRERPYVDASRVGLHGYSYGGYMTTWLIGHDDSRRFKAAVAGAPVVNLWSMWGVSDIGPSWGSYQWGDLPDDNFDWYRERSPITYVGNVQCPVLILHGESDWRVPISQGEEYFAGLRYRGKRAEMVRFPGCSHLMFRVGDPALVQEYYERMISWFDQYV